MSKLRRGPWAALLVAGLAGPLGAQEREPSSVGLGARVEAVAGVRLTEVVADGTLTRAGLTVGDVVTAVDGVAVTSPDALRRAFAATPPGARVGLSVLRGATRLEVAVELGRAGERTRGASAYLGLRLDAAGEELRVGDVLSPGPAAVAGVRVGDVLLSVNGSPARSTDDVGRALALQRPGDLIALGLRRGDASMDLYAVLGGLRGDGKAGTRTFPGRSGPPRGINESVGGGAYLGVQVEVIGGAVRIADVAAGSPAEQAGILPNDELVQFDAKPIQSQADLDGILATKKAGDRVVTKLHRSDQPLDVVVVLAGVGSALPDGYV